MDSMAIIRVPKPPKAALNKDRPISSLLKTQIRHLQEAEFRLPARAQTNIYINTIKTEGEAAEYIRQVTANLHAEHAAVDAIRTAKKKPKPAKKFEIAAMAKGKSMPKKTHARVKKVSSKRKQLRNV
jgi:hypothetical protein